MRAATQRGVSCAISLMTRLRHHGVTVIGWLYRADRWANRGNLTQRHKEHNTEHQKKHKIWIGISIHRIRFETGIRRPTRYKFNCFD